MVYESVRAVTSDGYYDTTEKIITADMAHVCTFQPFFRLVVTLTCHFLGVRFIRILRHGLVYY